METTALKTSQTQRVEVLYKKYGAVIYARCRWFLKDDALAQDATQDIFVRVMGHLDSAPNDETAIWWIYRITANRCFTMLRARNSHAQPVAVLPDVAGDHPEAELVDRELALRLMQHAPEKLRAAAVLYYLEGVEQSRIAAILGVSKRTVINRLNDFVARSRKYLARDEVSAAA
jgi:RNA polymerase sigma-70 factor (ECF subfamily)